MVGCFRRPEVGPYRRISFGSLHLEVSNCAAPPSQGAQRHRRDKPYCPKQISHHGTDHVFALIPKDPTQASVNRNLTEEAPSLT